MVSLNEQFAEQLQDLLYTLKLIKAGGGLIEGMPANSYFNFARSEISGLSQGFQSKDECKGCVDCCIKPQAVVPEQGPDGGLARPMRYVMKHRRQFCWWLRQTSEGYRCVLHDTGEKTFTCYSYQCSSREDLEKKISDAENQTQEVEK